MNKGKKSRGRKIRGKRKKSQKGLSRAGFLVTCYDTGATQGMTNKNDVDPGKLGTGPKLRIETGNGIVSSNLYEQATLCAEGTEVVSKNVVLANTSNTASIGALNSQLGFGYVWQEPRQIGENGCTYMIRSLEANAHSVVTGLHEFWPLRVVRQTPERADSDPTFAVVLNHCQTPGCKCGLPKFESLVEDLARGVLPPELDNRADEDRFPQDAIAALTGKIGRAHV